MPPAAPPTRPRPPLFRALGANDPPAEVRIGGGRYARVEIFKHDSWAATALYDGPGGRVVCKFNRVQPVFGLRTAWLGKRLADRERRALERLADLPNVPESLGAVIANGRRLPNAVARRFVPGHPLARHEVVGRRFYPTLRALLAEMHRRGIAYVDLHKRENILVGDDGEPYLIDFQIGFDATHPRVRWIPGVGVVFGLLRRSDDYHLEKHVARVDRGGAMPALPWWIRLHRAAAVPFREVRRRLLVTSGVRTGKGRVESEHAPEDAVRRERNTRRAA